MAECFERVAILGVGLIGGSMGMALHSAGAAGMVVGCSRTESRLCEAKRRGAIDSYTTDPLAAVDGADLVILCLPVASIPASARTIAPVLRSDAIVTDVGSAKACIVDALEELFDGRGQFVGGHPMAGSAQQGVWHARANLFHGATYFVTPTGRTPCRATDAVTSLAHQLGARPVHLPPVDHDRVVAAISHLPHVVASGLASLVPELCGAFADVALEAAAGSFADGTRVAGSDPSLWAEILVQNRAEVLRALASFRARLDAFESALSAGDEAATRELFGLGTEVRRRFEAREARPEPPGQEG
ncbi:MAG TPA: prephenate dehydrogenase [Armatimonadota bacterium]|nr:prephenate dehydrogenase [Armatimonadota bacterium]HQK94969.1 prephenate dehydrogenase [Armatimonadota bacterium]